MRFDGLYTDSVRITMLKRSTVTLMYADSPLCTVTLTYAGSPLSTVTLTYIFHLTAYMARWTIYLYF
jgi:hypothetical protein